MQKKGTKHTQEWKDKISILNKGNTRALGYKFTPELIKNRVEKFKKTFDLKGRKTEFTRLFRTQLEYRLWRTSVFERDNYTCVWCGVKGGKLNADHIKPFAYFPKLRLAIGNGRTLCEPCHKKTDTYGSKLRKIYG